MTSNRRNIEENQDSVYPSVKKSRLRPNDNSVEMDDTESDCVTLLSRQGDCHSENMKVESNVDYDRCNGYSNGHGSYHSPDSSMNGGFKPILPVR